MSGDVSCSYDGPDDRDTSSMVREFMREHAAALEAAGYCADHGLPRATCPGCAALDALDDAGKDGGQ